MSKAKDIMHWGAECVAASDTLETAARMMRDGHVGSLPICGPDNRLQGIITDRDIVVKCLAEPRPQDDHGRRSGPGQAGLGRRRRRRRR